MQAILFDCDGTLVHTHSLHFESLVRAGVPVTWEYYHAHGGLTLDELLMALGCDVETMKRSASGHFLDLVAQVEHNHPVVAVAREHFGKLPLAVASNGHQDVVEATLVAAGIRDLFDQVVTVDDVPEGKPAPDMFLEAARRLGVAPSDCLVYEDSDQGVEAARRAGMAWVDVRDLTMGKPVLV